MEVRSIYLDSLRGISILSVLYYHFVGVGPLAYGNLGVLLFFVISGYCIVLSIENSRNSFHFYAKRLGRLLPALVVCGLLTAAVKIRFPYLLEDRPVDWIDPFLTALSLPTLDLLGIRYHFPDWAYWSLVVEFQYYALVSLLLIFARGAAMVGAVILTNLGALALLLTGRWNHPAQLVYFLPFFLAGMSLHQLITSRNSRIGWTGIATALLVYSAYIHFGLRTNSIPSSPTGLAVLVAAVPLFWYGLREGAGGVGFGTRTLAAAGMISYPLYLLHQDIGNTVLHEIGVYCADAGCSVDGTLQRALLVPALMTIAAWAVFRFVETPTMRPLTRLLCAPLALPRMPSRRSEDVR